MRGLVDGEPTGALTTRQGPRGDHLQCAAVDDHHLARFALDVGVYSARTVVDGKLRFIRNRQRGDDGQLCGIEHSDVLALAVERKDVFALRLVQNGVGIVGGNLYFLNDLEAVEIEDSDRITFAVAGIAALQVLRESDAMNAVRAGNGSDDFPGVGRNHIDSGGAADE